MAEKQTHLAEHDRVTSMEVTNFSTCGGAVSPRARGAMHRETI